MAGGLAPKSKGGPIASQPGFRFQRRNQGRAALHNSPVGSSIQLELDDNNENEIFTVDENENISRATVADTKGKAKAFDPVKLDYSSIFDNEGFNKYINPVVFNLKANRKSKDHYIRSFTDFMFYRKKRKPLVKFPEDVVHEAELHGETAGKDREVRRAQKSPRRLRRVSRTYVYDGAGLEAEDEEDREDDDLLPPAACLCLYTCYEKCTSTKLDDDKTGIAGGTQFSKEYKRASDNFSVYFDFATAYIQGNRNTLDFAEKVFRVPEGYRRKEGVEMNFLAAQIWLCAFGVHHLFPNIEGQTEEAVPTRAEFEDLMTCFADVALTADRVSKRCQLYSPSHNTFGTEALEILNRSAVRLGTRETKLKIQRPVPFGKGLELFKRSKCAEMDSHPVKIMVRAGKAGGKNWENLNSQSKTYRLGVLKSLLDHTKAQLIILNTQMRFLVEDVFNGRFEEPDPHFLTCLNAMEGLIRKFVRSEQTTQTHKSNLIEVTKGLTEEILGFINRVNVVIRKSVEIRDMVQLAFRYLEHEYELNVAGFVPSSAELFTLGADQKRRCSCCFSNRLKGFNSTQFFHTTFRELLCEQPIRTKNPDGTLILKLSSPSQEAISVRFAGEEDDDSSISSFHSSRHASLSHLAPPAGIGGVWDKIESSNRNELKKQVLVLD